MRVARYGLRVKRGRDMDEIKKQADDLLEEIGEWESRLAVVETEIAIEIEEITSRHQDDLDKLKAFIKTRDSQLRRLIKKHKSGLFSSDDDRLDLEHGALLYSKNKLVKKAKGMLARLIKGKERDAIKVVESVNWDELEKWPDEKLKHFGTERKEKELFAYESFDPEAHDGVSN